MEFLFFFFRFLFGVSDVSDIECACLCFFPFSLCVALQIGKDLIVLRVFRGLGGYDEEQGIVHNECYDL
jgi:hypothetical protein